MQLVGYGFVQHWARGLLAVGLTALLGCGGGGASSSDGSTSVTSPPEITTQPGSLNVSAGGSATFAVSASGNGLSYQWERSVSGGASWSALPAASAATYVIAAVDSSMNGQQFRVVVQNTAGTRISSSATLTVGVISALPVITQQPSNITIETSLVASFAVAASGTPTPSLTWEVSSDGGVSYTPVAGETGATLVTAPTSFADDGKLFRAVASNSGGTVHSAPALLTVRRGAVNGAPHSIVIANDGRVIFTTRSTFLSPSGALQSANAQGEVGTLVAGSLMSPAGVAIDPSGNLLMAESGRHWILKIPAKGTGSTVIGSGALGCGDGTSSTACFFGPYGLASDSDGNVFVAEFGSARIRKVAPNGQVTTVAGAAGSGFVDGPAAVARFANPQGIAVDAAGNLFVADTSNHAIRKVAPDGTVTTFAGLGGQSGYVDGVGSAARFNSPQALAVDQGGSVFVADGGNGAIRAISPQGSVTTLAGGSTTPGYVDATGRAARFGFVTGIGIDAAGNLLVADGLNSAVRKVTQSGVVTTFVRQ